MYSVLKNRYFPFIFSLPLFFCVHHYGGIVLDAVLYLLQSVHFSHPERFINDPTFANGTQDSFSIFSPILAFFVKLFGVNNGMYISCFWGQLCWIVAAIFLIKYLMRFLSNRLCFFPIVIGFILFFADGMPHIQVHFFRWVENYTCSRLFSIAAGMAGIAFLLKKQKWQSVGFFILGTLIHPLTAGWGIPLWLFFFYPRTKWIVLVFSLVFPLTMFLHVGRFDSIAEDWLSRPLALSPTKDIYIRNVIFIAFFSYLVPKFFKSQKIAAFGRSVALITGIALYWNLWGCIGEHVFLYQVQPWREEWIPMMLSFLIYCVMLKISIRRWMKRGKLYFLDFSVFVLGLAMFAPQSSISLFVLALFFFIKSNNKISEKHILVLFGFVLVMGYISQQYMNLCLEDFPAIFGFDYAWLYRVSDSLLFCQCLLSVILLLFYFWQRSLLQVILFASFLFFPEYQLLPTIGIAYSICRIYNKKIGVYLVPLVIIVLFDSIFNTDGRSTNFFKGYTLAYAKCLLCIIGMGIFFVLYLFIKRLSNKVSFVPLAILFLSTSLYACYGYDIRLPYRSESEKNINPYYEKTIFPNVKNRGKIFFLVNGNYPSEPRLQFLTGAYMSYEDHVGEIFYKEHFTEVQKRVNLIAYKENRMEYDNGLIYAEMTQKFLNNRDLFLDRMSFLCKEDEIEYIVTDYVQMPFKILDKAQIATNQELFLYACSNE